MLEVIEAARRVARRKFSVRYAGRRPGDPAAIVAGADLIRSVLGWEPEWDDLDTIVGHAFAWERLLMKTREEARPIPA